jgi:hypothetical protein
VSEDYDRSRSIVAVFTDLIGPVQVEVVDHRLMVEVRVGAHRFRHDDLHELIVGFEVITRDLARLAASRQDAERRARENADLRSLSGEVPAVEVNE